MRDNELTISATGGRGLEDGADGLLACTNNGQTTIYSAKLRFGPVQLQKPLSAVPGTTVFSLLLARLLQNPSSRPQPRRRINCELIILHFVENICSSLSRVKMGRMHAPGKGICASSSPFLTQRMQLIVVSSVLRPPLSPRSSFVAQDHVRGCHRPDRQARPQGSDPVPDRCYPP